MSGQSSKSIEEDVAGSSLTVEAIVKQILQQQKLFSAELKSLKSFKPAETSYSIDEYLHTLLTPTGKAAHLTEVIVEIKETLVSYGEGWRKNIPKIAQATLIINTVSC